MKGFNLILLMLYRYVDDIRTYLKPINRGWFWGESGWYYDPQKIDDRIYSQRTVEEIRKSMDSV